MKNKKSTVLTDVLCSLFILLVIFLAAIGMIAINDYFVEAKKQQINRVYYNCTPSNSYAFCEALKEVLK